MKSKSAHDFAHGSADQWRALTGAYVYRVLEEVEGAVALPRGPLDHFIQTPIFWHG